MEQWIVKISSVPDYHEMDKMTFEKTVFDVFNMCDSDIKLKHQVSEWKQLEGCYCKIVAALTVDDKSGFAIETIAPSTKKDIEQNKSVDQKHICKWAKNKNMALVSKNTVTKDDDNDASKDVANKKEEESNKN